MTHRLDSRRRQEAASDDGGYAFHGPGSYVWDTIEREAVSWGSELAIAARVAQQKRCARSLGSS